MNAVDNHRLRAFVGFTLTQLWEAPIDVFGRGTHDSLTRDAHAPCAQRGAYDERTRFMRDLLDIMWQRHTCRAPFDPKRAIRESDMQCILDAARWAPTAHNMQNFEIIAVDDKQCLAAISAIQLPPAETFIRESHHPLSMSEAESLRSKTGLSASMLPESWQEAEWDAERRCHGTLRVAPSKSAPCCWSSSLTADSGHPSPKEIRLA